MSHLTEEEKMPYMIESDSSYVEELLCNVLYLESDVISKVRSFSDIGLHSKGRGLVITLCDGKRYMLPIKTLPPEEEG